jgi:hypothetical protein
MVQKAQATQKTVKYSPAETLMNPFITLLAVGQRMVAINTQRRMRACITHLSEWIAP